jgi:membrane protease YdiL (CAAX protease family)
VTANAVVGKPWASHATGIIAGITSGGTFLLGAIYFTGIIKTPATPAYGAGVMVTAFVAAVLAFDPVRRRVAGILHMEPENPVHALALVLAVILLGTQISQVVFVDVLALDQSGAPLTIADLFAQELPLLIIAVVGVGLFMRRTAGETALRLGVVRPAWWQVTLALAAGGLFVAFSVGIANLSQTWTPDIAHRIDVTTQHVFGGLANPANPVGIVALAVLPAICEEILFRGALQPRLGLVVTALLFTSIHTQYSISFDTLTVFILALGLGLIRKYTNTTTSAISHATNNLIAGLGIGSQLLGFAIAAEVVLAAVTAYGLWSARPRMATPSHP